MITYVVVIVLSGHAYLSYDTFKKYEDCTAQRDILVAEHVDDGSFIATCQDINVIFAGPPGGLKPED